jgi:hypothetical protein|tara:strand:- start:412 stop:1611 length:1200 start_codon:yes stop_codon:yes gene_type:complete
MKNKKQNNCVCEKHIKPTESNSISFKSLPKTEILTNRYIQSKNYYIDQKVIFCSSCEHLFINNVIDPSLIYNQKYLTASSKSFSGKFANDIFKDFITSSSIPKKFKHIVEIGSNDLYLLKKFYNSSKMITAIDPVVKKEKNYNKIKTIKDFFLETQTSSFDKNIDLIISSHTLEHAEHPKRFIEKVLEISSNKTDIFFQFPSAEYLLNTFSLDQIHHQHLNYFSIKSFQKMVNSLGGKILNFEYSKYHYGALMVHFCLKSSRKKQIKKYNNKIKLVNYDVKKNYQMFKEHIDICIKRIEGCIKSKKVFYVVGAGYMSPLINYHMKGIFKKAKFILDDDKEKIGKYFGGINVKISKLRNVNLKNAVCLIAPVASVIVTRKLFSMLSSKNADTIIVPKINF